MMGAAAPRSHLGPYGSREQALYGSQVPLYGPKPTGQDGPASLNITAGRTSYPAHIRRARTPGALSERAAPSRGSRTPVPLPDYDDDEREERQSTARGYPPVPRPRSRGSVANQSLVYYDIHDFEQRETLRGPGRGPPPMSTYSSRTSNYFR
ncbi:hypothetical protein FJT64_011349 [Amphibalanus amphitrite]|uniref:Uncharacterized protein n=2 Tax=Amphibalanus amphitrite TaxID=1232801 RepID=A0A6A4V9T1_AMPAM|nr:hypothetical protein FJT64_011349 [Amphibalanus amphitrite]